MENKDLMENHRVLNDLCHQPTAMANLAILDPGDLLVTLPDICGYNLYYGWYTGEWQQNDDWIDMFHEKYPDVVMDFSEHGADANPAYQSDCPEKGDWAYHPRQPTSGRN